MIISWSLPRNLLLPLKNQRKLPHPLLYAYCGPEKSYLTTSRFPRSSVQSHQRETLKLSCLALGRDHSDLPSLLHWIPQWDTLFISYHLTISKVKDKTNKIRLREFSPENSSSALTHPTQWQAYETEVTGSLPWTYDRLRTSKGVQKESVHTSGNWI